MIYKHSVRIQSNKFFSGYINGFEFQIHSHVKEWFNENISGKSQYSFYGLVNQVEIRFENEEDLVLFKLRWC